MKIFIILIFSILISSKAEAQIDINELYDKNWRTKTYEIVKPNSIVSVYSRYANQGSVDYGSVVVVYKKDGRMIGFDVAGFPYVGSFELLPDNHILSKGDEKPALITKLTDTVLNIEMTQPYTTILTNETYNITIKISYESFDPCAVYESLRSGDWNDPAIWTCQKIPTINDKVRINKNHKLIIPNNFTAYAKRLDQTGKLELKQSAKIIFGD